MTVGRSTGNPGHSPGTLRELSSNQKPTCERNSSSVTTENGTKRPSDPQQERHPLFPRSEETALICEESGDCQGLTTSKLLRLPFTSEIEITPYCLLFVHYLENEDRDDLELFSFAKIQGNV